MTVTLVSWLPLSILQTTRWLDGSHHCRWKSKEFGSPGSHRRWFLPWLSLSDPILADFSYSSSHTLYLGH